jgi:hypothetical protein
VNKRAVPVTQAKPLLQWVARVTITCGPKWHCSGCATLLVATAPPTVISIQTVLYEQSDAEVLESLGKSMLAQKTLFAGGRQ